MYRSKARQILCVVGILCACTASAQATLINVQILGQSSGNPTMPPAFTGAAMTGAAGDVWNGYNVDSNTNGVYNPGSINLDDASGAATMATFAMTTASGDNQAYSPSGTTGNALADSYCFAYTNPVSTGFEIAGFVPNSTCELYIYSTPGNWGSGDTTFTVNGVAKRAINAGQFTSVGWVEDNTYVHYASLTVDAAGKIVGTFVGNGVPDHAGFINGLQIVGTLEVPEPSTMMLMAFGMLGMVAYAWRKRR